MEEKMDWLDEVHIQVQNEIDAERNTAYDGPMGVFAGYGDPELCSCNGEEPCHRCGAHIGCLCHK